MLRGANIVLADRGHLRGVHLPSAHVLCPYWSRPLIPHFPRVLYNCVKVSNHKKTVATKCYENSRKHGRKEMEGMLFLEASFRLGRLLVIVSWKSRTTFCSCLLPNYMLETPTNLKPCFVPVPSLSPEDVCRVRLGSCGTASNG